MPRLDVAGAGWTGGRSGVYADAAGSSAVAIAIDWETELDAAQWAEAVGTYVNEAFDADVPGLPAATACGDGATCWSVGGANVALAVNGTRTALVSGPDVTRAAALARAAAG